MNRCSSRAPFPERDLGLKMSLCFFSGANPARISLRIAAHLPWSINSCAGDASAHAHTPGYIGAKSVLLPPHTNWRKPFRSPPPPLAKIRFALPPHLWQKAVSLCPPTSGIRKFLKNVHAHPSLQVRRQFLTFDCKLTFEVQRHF